ncbi:EamA family transporter [Acinetobacter boissieri]|uniref:Inner membrane transporter RhtA n=1 Tax=Acinetobacter boissieri TaxID=1219383 RepID=A0A1G6I1B8_9GAMM|nr:DMT family transporter [Acinetobacter boissieri]SDB99536.1 inner membrane transporter RhtA [Acinetobacter boissieri]
MQNSQHNHYASAVVLLIIAIFSIQLGSSFAKVLFQSHHVLVVAVMRLGFGAIILACFSKLWQVKFHHIVWKNMLIYGASLAAMNALFYLALARLPLGIVVAIEFLGPLSVALYYAKQKTDFIWVGLAVIGIVLLIPFKQTQHSFDWLGALYALGAGAGWAFYILSAKRNTGISNQHTVAIGMMLGACLILPFASLTGTINSIFNIHALGYFLVVAILSGALPFSLDIIVLKRLPPLVFGTMTSLEPAIAAMIGFIFLHETLLFTQWIALCTIISASIGCTYSVQRSKKQQISEIKQL